jgi:hypothetical protein
MKSRALLLALLLGVQTVQAAPLNPNDFASGYALQLSQEGAIHSLFLPEKVYTTVTQPSLADIRIFNGEEQPVPYLLKREKPAPSQTTSETDLPFSPLYGFVQTGVVYHGTTRIIHGPAGIGKGAAVNLVQTERKENEETRKMNGYLVETGGVIAAPFSLRADFKGEDDLLATLVLESSNDLTSWTPVGTETVARLNFQGHLIEKKFERNIHHKSKYLRLSWPVNKQGVVINQIRAITYSPGEPKEHKWTALKGARVNEKNSKHSVVLEFDSHGFLPVDLVRIGFPKPNNLIQATIKSRSSLNSSWNLRGGKIFYDIWTEGQNFRDDTLAVARTTDRYWRLEIAVEQEATDDSLPILSLGWTPHKLYFLSQGPAPFCLAFGNAAISPDSTAAGPALAVLLKKVESRDMKAHPVKILKEIDLGGPIRLSPLPPPTPWKKWLLWAVLLGGVLMIGVMSYNLYSQMKNQDPG